MKLHEEEGHENGERWLLTYADLITLLMIFFIVMYAMSTVDNAKYHKLAESLNSALAGDNQAIDGGEEGAPVEVILKNEPAGAGEKPGGSDITPGEKPITPAEKEAAENALKEAAEKALAEAKAEAAAIAEATGEKVEEDLIVAAATVKALMEEKGLENEVSVSISERGVVISLKDTVLFESGSAVVRSENVANLIEIGDAIKAVDNYVRVEGNTDNVPIHNADFSNNWELSVMRAATVLDLIVQKAKFPPQKISAIGYGEYRPITSNGTTAGKTKNRRVDIIILSQDYTKSESGQSEGSTTSKPE